MADAFAALVALLARLEDELPYVTVDDACAQGAALRPEVAWPELIAACIADQRLFTDARQRIDPVSGAIQPVRLVRLNRRHPQIAGLLED